MSYMNSGKYDTFEDGDFLYKNNQMKELSNVKTLDKGYGFVYRSKLGVNGKFKNVKIDCYASGDTGSYIRNAETGNYYKYKVGSKDEDLFFKVALSNGELNTKSGSNILFYDSPEQYESHLVDELGQQEKDLWTYKKNQYYKIAKK